MSLTANSRTGFSLVELLIVIAVITVIAAVLIPQISPLQRGASEAIARQQQAELQTALGNWVIAQSSSSGGLAAARTSYSGYGSAKLQLLQNYLQAATYASLSGSGDNVTSSALTGAKAYLKFSTWSEGEQPSIQWINQ